MKFLKDLFKRKEKQEAKELFKGKDKQEAQDIKPLINEFIKKGIVNSLKSKNVIENAEFILNTLFESNIKNINQMNVMGLVLKIKKKIGMGKEEIMDLQRLLKLFLKFMEEKGLVTEQMKDQMKDIPADIPPVTIKRETPKIGRNNPCSCGSGKKYKLCCGR